MYTFSNKLKTFSFLLIILGVIGMAYGFFTAPKTVEDVERILTEQHHDAGHGSHDEAHVASTEQGAANAHADVAAHEEHQKHLEHVLHQLQNKPWAAVYVACIFFMFISLGIFTFNQIQYAASAGWSPVLFRVMEGLSAYMLPGSIFLLILLVCSGMHLNHMFVWMADGITDPNSANYDAIIAGKAAYLNIPFFF